MYKISHLMITAYLHQFSHTPSGKTVLIIFQWSKTLLRWFSANLPIEDLFNNVSPSSGVGLYLISSSGCGSKLYLRAMLPLKSDSVGVLNLIVGFSPEYPSSSWFRQKTIMLVKSPESDEGSFAAASESRKIRQVGKI